MAKYFLTETNLGQETYTYLHLKSFQVSLEQHAKSRHRMGSRLQSRVRLLCQRVPSKTMLQGASQRVYSVRLPLHTSPVHQHLLGRHLAAQSQILHQIQGAEASSQTQNHAARPAERHRALILGTRAVRHLAATMLVTGQHLPRILVAFRFATLNPSHFQAANLTLTPTLDQLAERGTSTLRVIALLNLGFRDAPTTLFRSPLLRSHLPRRLSRLRQHLFCSVRKDIS